MEDAETDLGRSNDTSIQGRFVSVQSDSCQGQLSGPRDKFAYYAVVVVPQMPGFVVAQCMLSYRPMVAIAVIFSSFGIMNSVLTVCSSFVGNLIAAGT